MASRPDDMLGIGFAYTGVSSQIIDYEKRAGLSRDPQLRGRCSR